LPVFASKAEAVVVNCTDEDQTAGRAGPKFSKSITTYFFPVGQEVGEIVRDWVRYLPLSLASEPHSGAQGAGQLLASIAS